MTGLIKSRVKIFIVLNLRVDTLVKNTEIRCQLVFRVLHVCHHMIKIHSVFAEGRKIK